MWLLTLCIHVGTYFIGVYFPFLPPFNSIGHNFDVIIKHSVNPEFFNCLSNKLRFRKNRERRLGRGWGQNYTKNKCLMVMTIWKIFLVN